MFIPPFVEIISILEFNDEFSNTNVEHIQPLTWTRESSLPEAQSIVSRVADKAKDPFKPLKRSTINSETDKVLCELGEKQFSQTLCATLANPTYTLLDQRFGQAFRSMFKDNLFPISFINS